MLKLENKNSPSINFIYIVKMLTWLGRETEVYTRCQRLSIQSQLVLPTVSGSNTNMKIKPILMLRLPILTQQEIPHNL